MGKDSRVVPLAPLRALNSTRITDRALQGTHMRGGYNVQLCDGEWWVRKGQRFIDGSYASTSWWWAMDINADLSIIANPNYALAITGSSGVVSPIYDRETSESISFTNGSATATSSTTRTVGQLIIPSTFGAASELYRITAVAGTTVTLDRVYEGTTGAKTRWFLDPLSRNLTGTTINGTDDERVGSCVVFEQLVTNTATGVHGASPATTGGNSYLIITSRRGVPVAIDLTAYLSGSPAAVLRSWFYNTSIGTPAAIGSDTTYPNLALAPRGIYAEVYRNRLFIGYATDANGRYGDRTIWYSQYGDFLRWHTGIQGQTAAPNSITFDGEGDEIAEMKVLGDDLVVHRWYSQEVLTNTQSSAQPFTRRTHKVRLGIHDRSAMTNRCVQANGLHYIWTRNGPAVFDGSRLQLVARDVYQALKNSEQLDGVGDVVCGLHDERNRWIVWMLGATNANRHQDALPASSSDYGTVLVYKYDTDEAWLEDHPIFVGGGMLTGGSDSGSLVPQLHVFREDGYLCALHGRSTAKDAAIADPENGTAVTVNAQVETPWLDFGTAEVKRLDAVELVLRSISSSNQNWEKNSDLSSGNYWINMKVYTDFNEATAKATVGRVYDSTSAQLAQRGEDRQPVLFVVTLTPPNTCVGRQFKLVFSNALTSAASAAGYVQAPFRIHDIRPVIVDRASSIPLTELGGASISE